MAKIDGHPPTLSINPPFKTSQVGGERTIITTANLPDIRTQTHILSSSSWGKNISPTLNSRHQTPQRQSVVIFGKCMATFAEFKYLNNFLVFRLRQWTGKTSLVILLGFTSVFLDDLGPKVIHKVATTGGECVEEMFFGVSLYLSWTHHCVKCSVCVLSANKDNNLPGLYCLRDTVSRDTSYACGPRIGTVPKKRHSRTPWL